MFKCCLTFRKTSQFHLQIPQFRTKAGSLQVTELDKPKVKINHTTKLRRFFESEQHLRDVKTCIPDKYLQLRRYGFVDHLYLTDSRICKSIVQHILPHLKGAGMVCETNAGLGLITKELLKQNVKIVRIYESCSEFRVALKDINKDYPGRLELFIKDIFHLGRMSSLDKYDKGDRVEQLLKGVPMHNWSEGPVMTIIGTMTSISFIQYLTKMLALQTGIIKHGRIQIYALMRPGDFLKLSAGPHCDLHTYQASTVLFNLFFNFILLDKYPREAFLPWETKIHVTSRTRVVKKFDPNMIYLVRINLKKELPVDTSDVIALYYFVKQFFGRGTNKIIPTTEKWIPSCGLNFLMPSLKHKDYFKNLSIFTTFGELKPNEILALFKEMIRHGGYRSSAFASMIESELLKSETVETAEFSEENATLLAKEMISDLEEKLP